MVACLVSTAAHANSGGISGRSGKQGISCMNGCHGDNSPSPNAPTVQLIGPSRLDIGTTGDYALILRGGPAREGGMNVAVSDNGGTLMPGPALELKLLNGELTHKSPKTVPDNGSGELRFDFKLTAPNTPGTVTLYGAGNSVDDDGYERGDHSAAQTLQIQVIDPAARPPENDENKGCAAAGGPPLGLLLVLLASTLRRRAMTV
jgi:hypothetical protein